MKPVKKKDYKHYEINASVVEASAESLLSDEKTDPSYVEPADADAIEYMQYQPSKLDKIDGKGKNWRESYDYDYEDIDISKENPQMLLTSGSILTSYKAMSQNQKIKIMGRAKETYLAHKGVLKKVKIAKIIALTVFFLIQVFSVPRWCKADHSITDHTWCNSKSHPNSNIPKLSIYITFPVEMAALVLLSKSLFRNVLSLTKLIIVIISRHHCGLQIESEGRFHSLKRSGKLLCSLW